MWYAIGLAIFVLIGWVLYKVYTGEQQKNPSGGIASAISRPTHPFIEKDIERIYKNLIEKSAIIKQQMPNFYSEVEFHKYNANDMNVFVENIELFKVISDSIQHDKRYKDSFLLKNDIRIYNEYSIKINGIVEEIIYAYEKKINKSSLD